jgi:GNAT superfamily N-acetyltransferase
MIDQQDDELIFETDDGEVHYSFKTDNIINLDLIQAAGIGQGLGTKLMKEFIQSLKNKNIEEIHLFAEYDPFYYDEEQESSKGLMRLVEFYKSFGFETMQKPCFNTMNQIDMVLELK